MLPRRDANQLFSLGAEVRIEGSSLTSELTVKEREMSNIDSRQTRHLSGILIIGPELRCPLSLAWGFSALG